MKLSKLSLTVAAVLGVSLSSAAFAMDLYVDTKTKQIFAEPGKHRVKLGTFEQVSKKPHKGEHDFADIHAIEEDLALKNNAIKALEEHMVEADKHIAESDKVRVTMDKKGFQVRSADDNFKFRLGGRIHADASFHGRDNFLDAKGNHVQGNDGTEIRRARMRFEGVFYHDWLFRTEADFAGNAINVKDVYLQYIGSPYVTVTAGQQKQNFSRELQESSNDMMFIERSLMNVLNAPVVDRAIGLNFEHFDKNYVAKLGIFGNSIKPQGATAPASANVGDEGWGISSRITYAPINEKGELIHLGVAGNYRVPDQNGEVAKSKALTYVYDTTEMSKLAILNQNVTNVKDIKMLGLEAAAVYGPLSVGGEYTRTWIDRNKGSQNVTFDGWYAEAAWSITGESRSYKYGNMGYLHPEKPFNPSKNAWGAWELATRYSAVDLNDKAFLGGKMSNITVGLNWYINDNFRFLADYTRVLSTKNSPLVTPKGGKPDSVDAFMFRGQVAF